MTVHDCRPFYAKDSSYIPSSTPTEPAEAPSYFEVRGRINAGGTFFRTKDATSDSIEIEYVNNPSNSSEIILNVYYIGVLTETFGPVAKDTPVDPDPCVPTTNNQMRVLVNGNSNLIEMPTLDYGGSAFATVPTWDSSTNETCVTLFAKAAFSGGEGLPPTSIVNTIFTGPERTLIVLQLTEIDQHNSSDLGILSDPISTRKVFQFDGIDWITYIPNSDCCTVGVDC